MTRLPIILLVAMSFAVARAAAADDELQRKSAHLEELRERIASVEEAIHADREREGGLTIRLREIEERIGTVAGELKQLDDELGAHARRVSELRTRYRRESDRMAEQKRFLRRQIRAAYAGGREEYLRLLLNQEDPNRLDRVLVYYDYLNAARGRDIREAVAALTRLDRLQSRLKREVRVLQGLRSRRATKLDALRDDRDQREAVLAKLRARLDRRGSELSELKADAERVQDLVERLRQSLADIPEGLDGQGPFSDHRGELPWPIDGPLLDRSRGGASVRSALLIGADAGDPVHAVYSGRVVFADWLRGLGLLLIIDHGNGYMTLYGHNESLFKEAGDWVGAGNVIASVGASGGRDRAALYFEVRSNGRPVNPRAWLASRE